MTVTWIDRVLDALRLDGDARERLRRVLEDLAREDRLDEEPVIETDPLRCLVLLARNAIFVKSIFYTVDVDDEYITILASTNGDDETVVLVKYGAGKSKIVCGEWVR